MKNQNEKIIIEVGMGATEYLWSDREAYEVTKVVNQNDVFIRRYDVKNIGAGFGDNNWELISNEKNHEQEVVYRYNKWYKKNVITKEMVEKCIKEDGYWIPTTDKEYETVMNKGQVIRYTPINIKFGYADYYYDFSL